jgi:hypothetical protein
MPEPKVRWDFSIGNLVNLAVLIVGIGVAWGVMSSRSESSQSALLKLNTNVYNIEERVRTLELNQTRSDERLSNILQSLARIESRLERFENTPDLKQKSK